MKQTFDILKFMNEIAESFVFVHPANLYKYEDYPDMCSTLKSTNEL